MKKILALILVPCLLLGSLFLFSGCAKRVKYDNGDAYSTTSSGLIETEEEIHSVEIYWEGKIVSVIGSLLTDTVKVTEDETEDEDKALHYLVEEGVLKIYPCASGERLGDLSKSLILQLPLTLANSLRSLKIEVKGDTKVQLSTMKPASLEVVAEDGSVSFEDGTLDRVRVETVKGNLTVQAPKVTDLAFLSEVGNANISSRLYGFTAVMHNENGTFTSDYDMTQNGKIYTYGTQETVFIFDTEGKIHLQDYDIFKK